jgi:TRAP-type C4-dicarboxylate transport system substrate-binding protein
MKKTNLILVSMMVVVCAAFLFSHSQKGTAGSPIEIKMAIPQSTKVGFWTDVFDYWGKTVNRLTNGRVTYSIFGAQSLCKLAEAFDATASGIADFSHVVEQASPGRFPLMDIFTLPGFIPNQAVANLVMMDLWEKFPEFEKQYEGVKVLWASCNMPADLHTTKPVKQLDDIKGMVIGCQNAASANALKMLGASASVVSIGEMYTSVQRGVIDGVVVAWGSMLAWKLHEVLKHHTNLHVAPVTSSYIMNQNTWSKISETDRKVIDLLSWQLGPNLTARSNANQRAMMLRDYATPDKGHHIYYLSTEDEAKARVKYKPIWDKWVNDVNAKGYDGRKILDEGIWLVEKYKNA